ncbi:MAG: ABC transporter permease [Chloroflexi bacterium]|nr:ABC transporter permease [Chloroflexota bacterium]
MSDQGQQSALIRQMRINRQAARWAPPFVLVAAALVLWELAVRWTQVPKWLLPSPSAILRAGWEARGLLGPHIIQTALETLLGFCLALVVGIGLGFLIDYSKLLRNALYPLLVASQTVPTVAIAPLLVIWFGYGLLPKVLVVGLICFFPIVVSTADGLRAADPDLINLLRTMGASRSTIFFKVRLPGALPSLYSGIRIAITYSVVGAILGEWVGASQGLGIFMLRATNSFRTDWVFVSIAITAVLSLALFGLVSLIEHATLRWYYSAVRQESWEELRESRSTK